MYKYRLGYNYKITDIKNKYSKPEKEFSREK